MEEIVVIGGTNGIGRGVAEYHLANNDAVTVVGRSSVERPSAPRWTAIQADLSIEYEQHRVIAQLKERAFRRAENLRLRSVRSPSGASFGQQISEPEPVKPVEAIDARIGQIRASGHFGGRRAFRAAA